nr:solute carrier family 23 protein [Streptomyces sp. NRRL F-5126]
MVLPGERLTWPRTIGLGAQHVVAMFGATFVFPVVMGIDPNLAVLMSGVSTALFLLLVRGRIPSYLGTSASFVGGVAAIRAGGGDTATVCGAILVAGLLLAAVGLVVNRLGPASINGLLPPVVSGAVVLLIGFNLAPVVAKTYWPQDQWVALATMVVVVGSGVLLRGFWARLSVFIGLVFGYVLSWLFDRLSGPVTAPDAAGHITTHNRLDLSGVTSAHWFGLPPLHAPVFHWSAVLLVLPAVIALLAENTGHLRAIAELTGEDLDRRVGMAVMADGASTALSAAVGGSPTTTYAENIGVMAATRICSTAAYWVAALVAVAFGLCPKFGAFIAATPGGVLGGITVVLYGMIGSLGARIWIQHRVDFTNPVNLFPVAAGLIAGIGGVSLQVSKSFSVSGIALGTLITVVGHRVLSLTPRTRRRPATTASGDSPAPGGALGEPVGASETTDGDRKLDSKLAYLD